MEALAKQHCRPKTAVDKFKPSHECQVFREVARTSKTAADWIRYLRALRVERDQWKARRLEKAASDWTQFRAIHKSKKAWEGDYYRECQSEDPTRSIQEHFQQIFKASEAGDVDEQLRGIQQSLPYRDPRPITGEEIQKAVRDCKPNKAVGPDGAPNELLKCLVQNDTSLDALTTWFNQIYVDAALPEEWSTSVLKLLANIQLPKEPSQLRPIALSSHTCKVYATVITNRLREELQPRAARQLASQDPHGAPPRMGSTYCNGEARYQTGV